MFVWKRVRSEAFADEESHLDGPSSKHHSAGLHQANAAQQRGGCPQRRKLEQIQNMKASRSEEMRLAKSGERPAACSIHGCDYPNFPEDEPQVR